MNEEMRALFARHYNGFSQTRPQSGFSFRLNFKDNPSAAATEQMRAHIASELQRQQGLTGLSARMSTETPHTMLVQGEGRADTVGTYLRNMEQEIGYKPPQRQNVIRRDAGM